MIRDHHQRPCHGRRCGVIQKCMSNVLTLRIAPGKLARIDRRAAQLGQDRSAYVRGLIEDDLKATGTRQHRFVSTDLLGAYRTGMAASDNRTVRRVMRARLMQRHAKNR